MSMAAYFSLLPFLLLSIATKGTWSIVRRIIAIYSITLLILVGFMTVVDAELFAAWGFHLDTTFLNYLATPKEALSSAISSPLVLLLCIWILLSAVSVWAFRRLILKYNFHSKNSIIQVAVGLLLTAALIIPVRGGFQVVPINESAAYFSSNNLLNQAALNVVWNFIHTSLERYDETQPYRFMDKKEADDLVKNLYQTGSEKKERTVINTSKPNIILIIWESFTAKSLLDYGGKKITPHFQKYAHEGIYFSNVYASGDRSDKGLVAILSGFPASPLKSIIIVPSKSAKLPCLSNDLGDAGYYNTFFYGGEPEFANMKPFLFNHKFDRIVSKENFDRKYWNSKWGTHDEYVFERLKEESDKAVQPFFNVMFTLSSHEPFDIPIPPLLPPDSKDNLFLNSLHYTDQCLGHFLDQAKQSSWWKNTLIIIVADHGSPMPGGGYAAKGIEEFKIPVLWLGGALSVKDTVISNTLSQTDIAATLLTQLHLPHIHYPYSRNMLDKDGRPFAFYTFNNGFGYVQDISSILYRIGSDTFLASPQADSASLLKTGKAYLQHSFKDYLDK